MDQNEVIANPETENSAPAPQAEATVAPESEVAAPVVTPEEKPAAPVMADEFAAVEGQEGEGDAGNVSATSPEDALSRTSKRSAS